MINKAVIHNYTSSGSCHMIHIPIHNVKNIKVAHYSYTAVKVYMYCEHRVKTQILYLCMMSFRVLTVSNNDMDMTMGQLAFAVFFKE